MYPGKRTDLQKLFHCDFVNICSDALDSNQLSKARKRQLRAVRYHTDTEKGKKFP